MILIKRNHQFNLGIFSNGDHMLRLFQHSFIFGEGTSNFFRVITSTQQLLFWSSCFFRASAFLTSSLSRAVNSLQQLFFQNSSFFTAKLLPSSHRLRIGSYFGQLSFGTATFLAKELFRIKISTEDLLFRSSYFCTASTISEVLHLAKKR